MNEITSVNTKSAQVMDASELTVRVLERRVIADDVVALTLAPAGGGLLPPWEPGAHIDLVVGDSLVRQYSLCGDPRDLSSYRIAVLRVPDGRGGSQLIHDDIVPESLVRIRGPRNNFGLVTAERYLFIAGGIGITPMLVMADEVDRRGAEWRMLYGGRSRASMAFLPELMAYGEHVSVRPQDEVGLLDLEGAVRDLPCDTAIYACGPEPMLTALEEVCARQQRPALHVERFGAKQGADGADMEFTVRLARSDVTITVPPKVSILEAIENTGLRTAFACREGTCGSCETTVLDGTVDHRDVLLTEEERAANDTMMICVSRCRGGQLVLDL